MIREGLRPQNGGRVMPAPDIRNAASLFQLGHDSFQSRQPFIDKAMSIGGSENSPATPEQPAITICAPQPPPPIPHPHQLRPHLPQPPHPPPQPHPSNHTP